MNLSNLQPAQGSIHKEGKRVGRGQGSGKGGTATRGHKGAKSRSGFSNKIGFEGGQMPLQRRVPKFGFKNFNRKEYVGINLGRLQELVDNGKITDKVDLETLVQLHLVKKTDLVKILGGGELKSKLKISVHKFTASAKAAIEATSDETVTLCDGSGQRLRARGGVGRRERRPAEEQDPLSRHDLRAGAQETGARRRSWRPRGSGATI